MDQIEERYVDRLMGIKHPVKTEMLVTGSAFGIYQDHLETIKTLFLRLSEEEKNIVFKYFKRRAI